MELNDAKFIKKLPKGKHSVKGLGRYVPDPNMHKKLLGNQLEIPMGCQVECDSSEGKSLLYNEYVVYDVAQVNMKYLVKFKFEFNSLW